MAFTPKNWQNLPTTTTPISAAALVDLEQRLSGYSDTVSSSSATAPSQSPVSSAAASNGISWVNEKLNVLDPRFGAKGDDTTDDGPAFTAAMAALQAANGGHLIIPPLPYLINTTVVLPTGGLGNSTHIIDAYGANLRTGNAIPLFADAVPANTAAANTISSNRRLIIKGARFAGTAVAGQIGIQLIAHYGALVDDCSFWSLQDGVDNVFGLKTMIRNCFGHGNTRYTVRNRSAVGVWGDATGANSGSNHSKIDSLRDYAATAQTAQIQIEDSNGVAVDDCILEGLNPVNAINWQTPNTLSGVNTFRVRNLHSENVPTGAVIRTQAYGRQRFEDILVANGTPVIVDATGSNSAAVVKIEVPFIPGGTPFKGDAFGCAWRFDDVGAQGAFDPFLGTNWVGGIVPDRMKQIGNDSNEEAYIAGNSLRLGRAGQQVGFLGTVPVSKPTVTGSKGANVALASLLTALASYGLLTDSST